MKQRLFYFGLLVLGSSFWCRAQQDPRIAAFLKVKKDMSYAAAHNYLDKQFPEWQLSKMKNLCMCIGSRIEDPQPTPTYRYLYTRKFYEAARVDTATDSKATIAEKITGMWKVYEQTNLAVCNNTQFDVTDGSVLKYAVTTYFIEFVEDIIQWKIPLNKVDASDNRTLLDYIKAQLERNKGNALESKFQLYYDRLKAAGAKHRWEL